MVGRSRRAATSPNCARRRATGAASIHPDVMAATTGRRPSTGTRSRDDRPAAPSATTAGTDDGPRSRRFRTRSGPRPSPRMQAVSVMPRAYTDEPKARAVARVQPTWNTAPIAPESAAESRTRVWPRRGRADGAAGSILVAPAPAREGKRELTRAARPAARALRAPAARNAARVPRSGRRANEPRRAPAEAPSVLAP